MSKCRGVTISKTVYFCKRVIISYCSAQQEYAQKETEMSPRFFRRCAPLYGLLVCYGRLVTTEWTYHFIIDKVTVDPVLTFRKIFNHGFCIREINKFTAISESPFHITFFFGVFAAIHLCIEQLGHFPLLPDARLACRSGILVSILS